MGKRSEQVNVRLTPADFQVLEAAAFAHQLTPASLLADIAEEALNGLRSEPAVKTALRARKEAATGSEGTVSPIGAGRTIRRTRSRSEHPEG